MHRRHPRRPPRAPTRTAPAPPTAWRGRRNFRPMRDCCRIAAQTRRQQCIGAQRRVSLQSAAYQKDVASLRRADLQREHEARMTMYDFDRRHAVARECHAIVQQPSKFDPEAPIVGDDEAEILDLRNVDPGIIDFGDDALGDGEPQPRRTRLAPPCPFARKPRSGARTARAARRRSGMGSRVGS